MREGVVGGGIGFGGRGSALEGMEADVLPILCQEAVRFIVLFSYPCLHSSTLCFRKTLCLQHLRRISQDAYTFTALRDTISSKRFDARAMSPVLADE